MKKNSDCSGVSVSFKYFDALFSPLISRLSFCASRRIPSIICPMFILTPVVAVASQSSNILEPTENVDVAASVLIMSWIIFPLWMIFHSITSWREVITFLCKTIFQAFLSVTNFVDECLLRDYISTFYISDSQFSSCSQFLSLAGRVDGLSFGKGSFSDDKESREPTHSFSPLSNDIQPKRNKADENRM